MQFPQVIRVSGRSHLVAASGREWQRVDDSGWVFDRMIGQIASEFSHPRRRWELVAVPLLLIGCAGSSAASEFPRDDLVGLTTGADRRGARHRENTWRPTVMPATTLVSRAAQGGTICRSMTGVTGECAVIQSMATWRRSSPGWAILCPQQQPFDRGATQRAGSWQSVKRLLAPFQRRYDLGKKLAAVRGVGVIGAQADRFSGTHR
jgi:hypothetical protein